MAKKKNKPGGYFKVFIVLCVLLGITFWVVQLFVVKPHIIYPGFEIPIPSGFKIHGIDVSRYQHNINWQEVQQMESKGLRIGFAFIKATEGQGNVDNQFNRNWFGAQKAGITRGAYHFYVPGRDPAKQAKNFIQIVKLSPGDLPPVLDIEKAGRLSVSQLRNDVQQWLDKVEANYGIVPIIYTNVAFYNKYFSTGFEKYPLWIAHYLEPEKPRTEADWIFWQHSETGRANGISSKVDFNVFNGDSTAFRKLLLHR